MKASRWPASERPRERLLEAGPQALSDGELLAVLFGTGTRGQSAGELARALLAERGSLTALLGDSPLRIAHMGWASCAIFPVTVAIRWARRLSNTESEGADLGVVPAWLNRLLTGVYRAESSLAVRTGLPFGVSLAAIATHPE